ncbi:MAG: preprotein translocase subunit YajC [Opitutaceae bacterium]
MTKMIAQAAAPASSPSFPPSMILVWLLFIGGFYFLFIAPQKKKQKEHERMLGSLQTGDEIITTGGIYGTITNVKEDRFVVRVADNTKIEVGKGFIQSVAKKTGADEKKSS